MVVRLDVRLVVRPVVRLVVRVVVRPVVRLVVRPVVRPVVRLVVVDGRFKVWFKGCTKLLDSSEFKLEITLNIDCHGKLLSL